MKVSALKEDLLTWVKIGVPGDEGTWVIDNQTGAVCGVVFAWSKKHRRAYICPMQVIVEDIMRELGARSVCLPGSTAATQTSQPQERSSPEAALRPVSPFQSFLL
jgi:hypothetical protein